MHRLVLTSSATIHMRLHSLYAHVRFGICQLRPLVIMHLRSLHRLTSLWLIFCFSTATQGKPELFPSAIKFGANDCSFCHQTVVGGTALNERGNWLIEERTQREALQIDVDWLSDRGEEADTNRTIEIEHESAARTASPTPVERESTVSARVPMDYSTNWGEWPSYNGNLKAQKYSPLPYIDSTSIHDLELAWVWEAKIDSGPKTSGTTRRRGWGGQPFKATPLMVDGRVFVRTRLSTVVAIDAETGVELWEFDPETRLRPRPAMFGWTTRGLAYHKQSACNEGTPCERVILLTSDGWMYALNPEDGEVISSFGNDGNVDLTQGLRRPLDRAQVSWSHPPFVCRDTIVVGSQTNDMSQFQFRDSDWRQNLPVGDVRGFDPLTGAQKWVFKTIPQEGEFGVETWGNDSWRWMGNTNVWSTFSCDPELGHVYLPVTAPTNHMYGGDRPGDNLFGTSVVAVDIERGTRIWHFQITHHDIWDYDLPAPPVVADIVVDNVPRKVVAQVTKVGFLFVLDRLTGEPVWPVEERPVPKSDLIGEVSSPTQPHPTKPPPYELQGLTLENLIDLTPELRQRAEELIEDLDYGPLYTPISLRGTVLSPGIGGGANWPGAAFDPVERRLYVSSRRDIMVARNIPISRRGNEGEVPLTLDTTPSEIPYRESWRSLSIEGLPPVKPPWSNITAYDLDRGEISWQVANGIGPQGHRLLETVKDQLPNLGALYANPGILVLPDLLIMGHRGNPSTLKALDKNTGDEVWSTELVGAFDSPAPITYLLGNQQFIAIATGHPFEPARISAFRVVVGR